MELSDKEFGYLLKNERLPDSTEMRETPVQHSLKGTVEKGGRGGPKGVLEDYREHCRQEREAYFKIYLILSHFPLVLDI